MHHYSILDLSPIAEGASAAEALANSADLARAAEAAGYHRFWLAEHHNMPGIASAATAVVIGASVCAAETDEEARYLDTSHVLAFARIRMGRPGKLPRPVYDLTAEIPAAVLARVKQALSVSATGGPETLHRQLEAILARHRPDEVMLTGMIHDHAARVRSFEIAADVLADLAETALAR